MNGWFWIFIGILTVVILAVWRTHGPRRAVGAAVFCALLAPEWVHLNFTESIWITVRLGAAIIALSLYLFHPKSTFNFKLQYPDYAMLALIATHVASDIVNEGFNIGLFLRAYGEWFLPYICGRLAIQTVGDARWLVPWVLVVASILAVLGVSEAFLGVVEPFTKIPGNQFEQLVGIRPDGDTRELTREVFGGIKLRRAFAQSMHTIFFGALQFMFFPFAVYAYARSMRGNGPWWWRLAPLIVTIGIFSTITRSVVFAIPIVFYVSALILYPKWRWILGGLGVASVVTLALTLPTVIGFFEKITGEADAGGPTLIIDGQKVKYTGTQNRKLLFRVYDYALLKAGPLGFGTKRCSTFPPNVPHDPKDDPVVYQHVRFIDNEFLFLGLRFGYLGAACFAAAIAATVWSYAKLAATPGVEGAAWLAAAAGTVAAMAIILCTVFMPTDIGLLFLFLLGASAGLVAERANPLVGQMEHAERVQQGRSHRRHRPRHHDEEGHRS